MLDTTTPYYLTPGPSRSLAVRVKEDTAEQIDALLATTGETYSDLVRRLLAVHLDAVTEAGIEA